MEEEKSWQDCVLEKVESKINEFITNEDINRDNVDYLYKLEDIHKDLKNEKYWKIKEEKYNDEIRRLWCKKKGWQKSIFW